MKFRGRRAAQSVSVTRIVQPSFSSLDHGLRRGRYFADSEGMTADRKTLSLRLNGASSEEREAQAAAVLTEAIGRQSCARWSYNRTLMLGAPQILYRKNDALHCDAVVIERNGVLVVERKLGSFKVAGLSNVSLTSEPFARWPEIDLADPRYADGVVLRAGV